MLMIPITLPWPGDQSPQGHLDPSIFPREMLWELLPIFNERDAQISYHGMRLSLLQSSISWHAQSTCSGATAGSSWASPDLGSHGEGRATPARMGRDVPGFSTPPALCPPTSLLFAQRGPERYPQSPWILLSHIQQALSSAKSLLSPGASCCLMEKIPWASPCSSAGIPMTASLQLKHKANINYLHYLPSKLASAEHKQPPGTLLGMGRAGLSCPCAVGQEMLLPNSPSSAFPQ